MNIPKKKIEYIDNEIFNLINLVEITPHSQFTKVQFVSGDGETVINLPLATDVTNISEHLEGGVSITKRCFGNECRGLNKENHILFLKFINTIYKEKSINSLISKKSLEGLTFNYIIDTHVKGSASPSFSSYLIDAIMTSIKEFEILCSIQHLEISTPFEIGNVKFKRISNEVFEAVEVTNPEQINLIRKTYGHKYYATYVVTAELEKAKEIAFKQCCLAIDILKICSETVDFPNYKISFDLDPRTTESFYGEMISFQTKDMTSMITHNSILPKHYTLNAEMWERMKKRHFKIYNDFLSSLNENKTELEKLILKSIEKFARALSVTNLNQRIADIFTIFESLLLIDQNSPIIDNVTKYSSKIVFKTIEQRKEIIALIKKMYGIRSKYMHHAIND